MRYAEAGPGYSGEGGAARQPAIPSSVLAMLIFVIAEVMFFTALVSAYILIASKNTVPLDQPRLPVIATAINSLFLLGSGVTIFLARRAFKEDAYGAKTRTLVRLTLALGTIFVVVQGFEWAQLIGHGFTMTSSVFGGLFYLIIGTHALHAIGAICGLWWMYSRVKRKTLKDETFGAVSLFWYFVVAVWPVLYILVYLD